MLVEVPSLSVIVGFDKYMVPNLISYLLTAIGSLKTFDIPFLITSGGPSYATEFLGTQIYRVSISFAQVGYGASLSVVLLVLALAAAVVINVGGRRGSANDV